jgi:hypothetical protein
MIPVASTISVIPPAPLLVNTSVPGSITVRPPHDNVVPSVSTAAVGGDARGNSDAVSTRSQAPATSITEEAPFPSFLSSSSVDGIATAQTNFFAQLLGQGGGENARALLVVYEKLLSLSQVRYKPSNALAPLPQPSGVFGRLLQQEKSEIDSHLIAASDMAPEEVVNVTVEVADQPGLPFLLPDTASSPPQAPEVAKSSRYNYDVQPQRPQPAPKAAEAYTVSIIRNNTPAQGEALETA